MLRQFRWRGALVGVAVIVAIGLVVAALAPRERAPADPFGPDHGRWVALATAQAATFAAPARSRGGASPAATPTRTATRVAPTAAATATAVPATPGGAASPAPPTTTTAVPTATPTDAPTPVPTPSVPPAPTATASFLATHRVTTELWANLRAAPGTAAALVAVLAPGTPLAATGEEANIAGEIWRRFALADGRSGWLLGSLASPV